MARMQRRQWIRSAAAGLGGLSVSGLLPALAEQVAGEEKRRHVILLWMNGGPSQTDTFDMKPQHENGGEFKEIATNVPGIRFSEQLPRLAKHGDKLAIVRSLKTKEGDHARGTHLMRTGQRPMGPVNYPAITCALGKELGSDADRLPRCVSVAPYQALSREAFGPGFLGPKYTPLVVNGSGAASLGIQPATPADGFADLRIESLHPLGDLADAQMERRRALWNKLQGEFVSRHAGGPAHSHDTVYRRSMNLMNAKAAEAFDLSKEPESLRESYGKGVFGQGCLMARRLVERGVPVVEVSLGSWDTHSDIFTSVANLSQQLDAGWASLMEDLSQRGLLEQTTILWMGEFGRTPQINASTGRDHFPAAWSCVFAGGGIAGGQVYGSTSDDGTQVEENPVDASDVLATLVQAAGVDPAKENQTGSGRPIMLTDGFAINDILT